MEYLRGNVYHGVCSCLLVIRQKMKRVNIFLLFVSSVHICAIQCLHLFILFRTKKMCVFMFIIGVGLLANLQFPLFPRSLKLVRLPS